VTTHVNTGEVLMNAYINEIINKYQALLCYINLENDDHSQGYPPQPSKQTCFGVENNKVAGKVRDKL
ncbi:hypothetical protein, partial [Crocosphaera watsonii]